MNSESTEELERHLSLLKKAKAFNPVYLYVETNNLRFNEALKAIPSWHNHQYQLGKTKKTKQSRVIEKQQTIVSSILANFLYRNGKPLTITRSKRILELKDRYRPKWLTYSNFIDVLDILMSPEVDIIKQTKGGRKQVTFDKHRNLSTVIELTDRGKTFITAMDKSFIMAKPVEPIQLKEKNEYGNKERVQYDDTEHTLKLRKQMDTINSYLQSITIFNSNEDIYYPKTGLYRVYYDDFKKHGRLYGGSWYNLKGKQRLELNVIKDDEGYCEPLYEIDFRACSLSILSNLNLNPLLDPYVDPYQKGKLQGFDREGIKTLINAYINHPKMEQYPKGVRTKIGVSAPPVGELLKIVFEEYPYLNNFTIDINLAESEIITQVMLKAIAKDLLVVPLHDALYVADSCVEALEDIVNKVTRELTGYPLFYFIHSYDYIDNKPKEIGYLEI